MKNMTLEKIYTKLANSDILIYLVWLLLLLLLVFTIKLQYFSILFSVICANIGIVVFLIFKNKNRQTPNECEMASLEREENNSIQINGMIPVVSSILFLIIYSASLLSLFLGDYTKTVAYYLCISLCAGILIIEILSYRTQIQGYGILLKTVLLSINVVFSNSLIFIHGISLPDLYLHLNVFVMSILDTGHLSDYPLGPYGIFSIHHIFASEIAILTGYNPMSIYLLFGSFIVAIGVLFVFIIGKRFVNFQFGLVTALVFTCLDYYLMYGEHPEHQAYNNGFALICFTLIIYTYRFQKPAFYVIFVFSAVAMTLTHHLTTGMIFVTVCSLVIIDVYYIFQKRVFSLPSIFIAVTFFILLFCALCFVSGNKPVQFAISVINPYFKGMYALVANLFVTPIPVTPIPVTPIPVTPIPVTPIPVTPIPVTPIPVTPIPLTPIPVTPIPVTPIPVTPIPVTPPPYVPPMGYDKLPLISLFENTLGSSLLVLVSVMGFCSCIKKRSWFGDFTILNGILLSILLGMGILFSFVFFLPDRIYPFLQIFCLVFLGATGILWLYNAVPSRKWSIIVGCICILIVLMSFFSLASIINGFETSPFVDGVAYARPYTTSQDLSYGNWRASFIQNEKLNILPLPINNKGSINIDMVPDNSYLSFDRTLLKTGFANWGIKFGQHSFVSVDKRQFQQLDIGSTFYDNGQVILLAKKGPI